MTCSPAECAIMFYAAVYLLTVVVLVVGVKRVRLYGLPAERPHVSVIVCARNEEDRIGRCLDSLMLLDYPCEKLEIIVVDDDSTDRTAEIVKGYLSRSVFVRLLAAGTELHSLPGKQRPLNKGIYEARGEFILLADADIRVQPGWIKGHLAAYGSGTGIVGGITQISTESGGLLAAVQNADQISKLTIAMACAGLGVPLTIMGNNCSFRREAFMACGGFGAMGESIVEDVALMYHMTQTTDYRLGWAKTRESVVFSEPEENLPSFIEQRYRMATILNRAPLFGKMLLGMEIAMVFAVAVSVVLAIVSPTHPFLPAIIAAGSWVAGNALLMASAPGARLRDILTVPGMFMFQLIYGKALSRRMLFGNKQIVWKGRSYNTV